LNQAERDIFPHRQAIEQGSTLEQHAEFVHHLFAFAPGERRNFLVIDFYAAGIRLENTQNTFQKHRLAGAGTANDHDRLTDTDIEVNAAEDMFGSEALGETADLDLRSCR